MAQRLHACQQVQLITLHTQSGSREQRRLILICLQSSDQPDGIVLPTLNLGLLLAVKQSRTFSWT